MKVSKLILPCVAVVMLVGCKVKTPNGQIPQKYAAEAQKLMGNYKGKMQKGSSGVLSLRLVGTKVVAKFSKPLFTCGGTLGNLLSVEASGKRVTQATFQLKGANCVEGSTVSLAVSKDNRVLSATVLDDTEYYQSCPTDEEIWSCESGKEDAIRDCMAEGFSQFLCENQQNVDCTSCSTQSNETYTYGSFQR